MELVKLNLARNCIKYLIRLYGIEEIFIPYYICDTVWQAIREEKCNIRFYHIGNDFLPCEILPKKAYIIYPNYFGLCGENCKKLAHFYPKLIVDNTQAFYFEPIGFASFYSLRKFFPVTNGAYLYLEKSSDSYFEKDLPDFDYVSPEQDYDKFVRNELILNNQKNIKFISDKVENCMANIDFQSDKISRIEIYNKYCKKYNKYNKLHFNADLNNVPYCYPFSPVSDEIKDEIIFSDIPLIRLWKDIPKDFIEYNFADDVVAMPLNSYSSNFV